MKIPRNVSGNDLIKVLAKFGYVVTRQKGSHIRLSRTTENTAHHISVPNHNPIKLGTLSGVLNDVSIHLNIDKEEVLIHL